MITNSGVWWCARCQRKVPADCVSWEERHDVDGIGCGEPVEWIPTEDWNRLATLAEQAGVDSELLWQAAEACPQGHSNREPECGELNLPIGDICFECRDEADVPWPEYQEHWEDLLWHPEWRIGRVPRDFTDPGVLWPVWEAYVEHPHANLEWEWYRVQEGWLTEVIDFVRDEDRQWKGVGATITEAMAQILHQMLEDAAGEDPA